MAANIIIGAGFAGCAAARALEGVARTREDLSVVLLDANPYTTMIPSLPDLAGGRMPVDRMTERIERQVGTGITFRNERVDRVNFDTREVVTDSRTYRYDYLVMAAGSVTNFYGFDQHLDAVHKLDVLDDANRLRHEFAAYLRRTPEPAAVIAGAGYTGLELACNLQFAGRQFQPAPRVCIVEMQDRILPAMPDWVRTYMAQQAQARGIELITGAAVERFDGTNVTLSNGRRIEDAFLCWTTGTRFSIDRLRGKQQQTRDGRLEVDATLRLPQHPEVFAAGDAAALRDGDTLLRKAVNFSRDSGRHAGQNLVRLIQGHAPKPFRPVDLGWVIPFGNVGVGVLFQRVRVRGRLPLALHYFMCGLRNYNAGNRMFFWKTGAGSLW